MMGKTVKRALVGGLVTVALGVGMATPAGASTDSLESSTGSTSSLTNPPRMTYQTLIAARDAGLPIYEAAFKMRYPAPKSSFWMIEYRRVSSDYDLSSATTKFVALGEAGPDTFWVNPDRTPGVININRTWQEPYPMASFEPTDQRFTNSPVLQLPGGGPGIGIAYITTSGSNSSS
ncbi:hypothetical protein BFN03_17860 [Rhodococcus sp. WMMA185]|uniref:hypothetical protein n=1 Tax=Rhodococcus sp. WMMA185 TaxID=679318 RepID=UPI0008782A36|nr:hypothetical protein [Rhodococcus sp. WMMA185]AOW93895.1 hypothetical protein BFN03_17860 [Rhodococcus sp. WMMA185]